MERAPLPSPLPARASQGEGAGDFSDGGCIKMRPATVCLRQNLGLTLCSRAAAGLQFAVVRVFLHQLFQLRFEGKDALAELDHQLVTVRVVRRDIYCQRVLIAGA